ncbi:hypothetical protein NNC19_07980 [Clostridium sp. SHJSY1]|uniref:cohesin domain-containing protein n=1 Tax=Clostridium sp. SHJSY1 TaxID=2942483 RepID=UPI002875A710|nr:hypothetical protein [Clostridium sp. SHJSY1]MDS0525612.1 hypothetical protein [Clostridium sp. SHJSY1]
MKKTKCTFGFGIFTIILTIILFLILPYNKVVLAADNREIKFSINGGTGGEVKAGSAVEINVDLNNLPNFFGGSVDYTYDNTLLEVNSIEINPKIKENNNIYIAYNETAKDGNLARYGFAILGESSGINGTTRFLTIKGKAKKDGNLSIKEQDVAYEIVGKSNKVMVNMDGVKFSNGKEVSNEISEQTKDLNNPENKNQSITSGESNGENGNKSDDVSASSNNTGENSGNKISDNSGDKTSDSSNDSENKEEIAQGTDSLEKSFGENSPENKSSNDSKNLSDVEKKSSSKTYIYISLVLGIIAIGVCIAFIYKKRKNNFNNLINK